jgi:hypothetical protein
VTVSRAVTRLGVAALIAVLLLAVAGLYLGAQGRTYLARSDAAFSKGDAMRAVVHARSAARAYVPGASHMERAYAQLRQIAEASERRGDTDAALFAWRAILSAATASRPFAPCGETCSAAEAAITRLGAATIRLSRRPASAGNRAPAVESSSSAAAGVPEVWWRVLVLLGAALLGFAGLALSRAWSRDSRPPSTDVRVAAVMAVAGLAMWALGLVLG